MPHVTQHAPEGAKGTEVRSATNSGIYGQANTHRIHKSIVSRSL